MEVIVDSVPVATPIIVPVVESKDNEFGENYVNIDPADIPSICISWFLCLVPVNLSDISINIDYPYTSILLDSIKSVLREKPNVSQSILDSLQINTVIIWFVDDFSMNEVSFSMSLLQVMLNIGQLILNINWIKEL